jgi:hypothetical protein
MAAIRLYELEELDKLEERLAPLAGKIGGDYDTRVQYLRMLRKLRVRRSESVVLYGQELVRNKAWRRRLGAELWDVYEQVRASVLTSNQQNQMHCLQACLCFVEPHFRSVAKELRLSYPFVPDVIMSST